MVGNSLINDLCHIAAISGDENNTLVMENLVKASFLLTNKKELSGIEEVLSAIKDTFRITVNESTVQSCIDKLINKKELLKNNKTKKIQISTKAYSELEKRIEESRNLESIVKKKWIDDISKYMVDFCEDWEDKIWDVLASYLAKIFRRHGVQTISLICPDFDSDENLQSSFDSLLQESLNLHCNCVDSSLCVRAISEFFNDIDDTKSAYLSQILDGTFNYFSLSVEDKTMSLIRSMANEIVVFLDTNFIFGLIDLGDDHEEFVSKNILKSIKKNNLPYKIVCHRVTIEEIQRYLHSCFERLKGKHWSQSLSRAAISTNELSGADLKFHKLNSDSPMDVEVFFSKFDHIEKLLEEMGISVCEYEDEDEKEDLARHESVARFKEYTEETRKYGGKTYQSYNHDMTLLSAVKKRFKLSKNIFESRSIILTNDNNLFNFVRKEFSGSTGVAPIAMPRLFLQLISAFSSDAKEVKKGLVETFAMPEFRALRSDYKKIKQKALSYLALYSGVSEETAIKILANEILLRRLKKVEDDELKFQAEIDSALVDENNRLAEETERLEKELSEEREALHKRDRQLESALVDKSGKETELDDIKKRLVEIENLSSKKIDELNEQIGILSDEKKSQTRKIKVLAVLIYLILVIALFFVFYEPILSFLNNSKKPLNVKVLSAIFLCIFPCYVIFPGHFWKWVSGQGAVFFAWLNYR